MMDKDKINEIILKHHETLDNGSSVVPWYNWDDMVDDIADLANSSKDIRSVSDIPSYSEWFNSVKYKIGKGGIIITKGSDKSIKLYIDTYYR